MLPALSPQVFMTYFSGIVSNTKANKAHQEEVTMASIFVCKHKRKYIGKDANCKIKNE